MNTYEVFLKKAGKEPFSHAGSLDAPDDELAVAYAQKLTVAVARVSKCGWLTDPRFSSEIKLTSHWPTATIDTTTGTSLQNFADLTEDTRDK